MNRWHVKHILIIDDDRAARGRLTDYLTEHSLQISAVATGREAESVFATGTVDLVVIDTNLGSEDGLDIVRKLTATSDLPIIIVSEYRTEEADKVAGLELGATDYVSKPFSMREFLARVRAGLRYQSTKIAGNGRSGYRFNGWRLSLHLRKLSNGAGEEIRLTVTHC